LRSGIREGVIIMAERKDERVISVIVITPDPLEVYEPDVEVTRNGEGKDASPQQQHEGVKER
jgi:hypothetical protein